jgi:hypothetical protein
MKLPRNPKGMFDRTHSGRRFSASDMPMLRSLRDTYAKILRTISEIDWSAEGPGMVLAAARVRHDIEDKRRTLGRVLSLLERTPPVWRP